MRGLDRSAADPAGGSQPGTSHRKVVRHLLFMSQPVIRVAAPSDVDTICKLGSRTFMDAFIQDNDPIAMGEYVAGAFDRDRIAAELKDPASEYMLLFSSDREPDPSAYSKVVSGSMEECVSASNPIELERLYVDGDQRNRGYGATLLRVAITSATKAEHDVMWLGVWEHNEAAQRFYRRFGFEHVGQHEFLLGADSQVDLVMAKRLLGLQYG